jgi:hypothetical protein
MEAGVWVPPVVPAAKHAAANPLPALTPAKKHAGVDLTKFIVLGVVTQALFTDDQSRDNLAVVVTMPANVTHRNQLTVNFVPSRHTTCAI